VESIHGEKAVRSLDRDSETSDHSADVRSLRLFVAVELSDEARTRVSGVIEHVLASGIKSLRAVRPEAVHLTLKFLGNVPSDRVDTLVEALRSVAGNRPAFAATLNGSGVFPSPTKARVLWLGIGAGRKALGELHLGIEDAVAGLGYARDRKPFNPHLTVARLGERTSRADRLLAANTLANAPHPDGVEIPVRSIALMQSNLSRSGAIHRQLAVLPLGLSGPIAQSPQ
jgi:2'-5' RNA ligase